jgi:hypothetical protein
MAGPENQNGVRPDTAGAEGALKRYGQGTPFIGAALAAEHEAQEAIKRPGGLDDLLEQNAARLQAISSLYYEAMTYQAAQGDLEKFDQYAARYGWLTSKTILALAELRKNRKAGGSKLSEVLDSYAQARTQEGTGTAERSATVESGTNHGETEAT